MPENKTIEELAQHALKRNKRSIDLLTSFCMESAAMVLVFGILDTYASGKLTLTVIRVVAIVGFSLLIAAFGVQWVYYRLLKLLIRYSLTIQEHAKEGGSE
jgi:hypothetical protein